MPFCCLATSESITAAAVDTLSELTCPYSGIETIKSEHHIDNIASGKVMQKAGMKYEGTLRAAGMTGEGKLSDLAYYSILRNEFK